jgi:ethanolamine ammonia-lyase large subunit
MRVQDLVLVASKLRVVTRFRNTLGLPRRLAARLQPNHPTDDAKGIAASIIDGLLYGCGDAVIGINPATDNLEQVIALNRMLAEIIARYAIPTQSCILTHVSTTMQAMQQGAPVDLVFQSRPMAGVSAKARHRSPLARSAAPQRKSDRFVALGGFTSHETASRARRVPLVRPRPRRGLRVQ